MPVWATWWEMKGEGKERRDKRRKERRTKRKGRGKKIKSHYLNTSTVEASSEPDVLGSLQAPPRLMMEESGVGQIFGVDNAALSGDRCCPLSPWHVVCNTPWCYPDDKVTQHAFLWVYTWHWPTCVLVLTRCSTRIADANGWSRSSYTGFWNKHGRGQRAVIWKGPSPLWIPLFRPVLALPFISEQMTDLPGSVVPTSASLSLVPIWRKVIKAFLLFVYLLYVFVHFILRPPPAVCPYSLHRWELSFV